jgi:beta-glucanase (GH16 family)
MTPPPPPPPPPAPPPPPPPGTYTFADEFDGPVGSAPDSSLWNVQTGPQSDANPGASGNHETANCFVDGNSNLVIRATSPTASGRMNTLGKFAQEYGTFEAKLKFAHNAGCWPSWWFMGSNPSSYPACGEVDAWEVYGNSWAPDTTVWSPSGGNMVNSQTVKVPAMSDGNWHIWRMDWVKGAGFTFYQDGNLYFTVTPSELPNWTYDSGNPLHMVINQTLGGSGGGTRFGSFPHDLLCDYIHVSAAT